MTVDGQPLDAGTIQLQPSSPVAANVSTNSGSSVQAGKFQIPASRGLRLARYRVTLVGFRRTGRMIHDHQRGDIEERVPIAFSDDPVEITISADNARALDIAMKSAR